ncbi:MAG: hypothetical protein ABJD07_05965 [Gemmatimonadaceae bacterium]
MIRAAKGAALLALVLLVPATVLAQGPLSPIGGATAGPLYQMWSFGSGLYQPNRFASDSVQLKSASQWSVPISGSLALSDMWTIDASITQAWGTVKLRAADPVLRTDHYSLSGLTDLHVRLTGQLIPDRIVFTLGLNPPTGKIGLDDPELEALRVIAAPALGFRTPSLGSGIGASAGLVAAQEYRGWSFAFGTSYEVRGTYSPVTAFTAGALAPDFDPGDAVHLSLGSSGAVGQSRTTLTLAADFFRNDRLTYGGSDRRTASVQLGPVYSAEWQYLVGTTSLRELRFFVADRYRMRYKVGGARVGGTSGNYLDGGVRIVAGLAPSTGLSVDVDGRYQTGLSVDRAFTTAGVAGGGVGVGLIHEISAYTLQPFVRAQYARFDMKGAQVTGTGFSAGLSLGTRF